MADRLPIYEIESEIIARLQTDRRLILVVSLAEIACPKDRESFEISFRCRRYGCNGRRGKWVAI